MSMADLPPSAQAEVRRILDWVARELLAQELEELADDTSGTPDDELNPNQQKEGGNGY
jgi:hypothetical protein